MTADDHGEILAGYVSGPAAATEAIAVALTRAAGARVVILVEGISDQIAVETLAARRGRDLRAEGAAVVPIGGAHAVTRYLRQFGPDGAALRLAGLCDAGEEDIVRRGMAFAGLGSPGSRADMDRLGFQVCDADLEEELIRAAGRARVEEILAAQGDLGSFRALQRQPAWQGRSAEAQLRRFLGAGARRKLRYARLLVDAIDLDRMPRPLEAVLAAVRVPSVTADGSNADTPRALSASRPARRVPCRLEPQEPPSGEGDSGRISSELSQVRGAGHQ
jgi:hypothetical protein